MLRQSIHNLEEFQLAFRDFQMTKLIEEEKDEGLDNVLSPKGRRGELMAAQLNTEQKVISDHDVSQ
ncbi:hypothetical protein GHT06_008800 [Daphnia sinensis]|uniref:Uncharacterized protein n=1 Tax=Daphnia sinensis TaxID=1820382 RepID=A0AAD5LVY2_9CRUS|nr:hypothetical protein GHT06_008800 [Daphnia sinensis]